MRTSASVGGNIFAPFATFQPAGHGIYGKSVLKYLPGDKNCLNLRATVKLIIIIFIHQNTNTGTYEITYNNRYKAYLYNSYKI